MNIDETAFGILLVIIAIIVAVCVLWYVVKLFTNRKYRYCKTKFERLPPNDIVKGKSDRQRLRTTGGNERLVDETAQDRVRYLQEHNQGTYDRSQHDGQGQGLFNKGETSSSEQQREEEKPEPVMVHMYAAVPRMAEDVCYFADISVQKQDKSRFEIIVDPDGANATFIPLDYMLIRTYDFVKCAVATTGVSPSEATAYKVSSPGRLHLDEGDWIIDEKVKLTLN